MFWREIVGNIQLETLGFVLFKLKEQYKDFFKTPLFAFDVVYQCGYVSSIGEEDSPILKILVFLVRNLNLLPPLPLPPRKLKKDF